MPNHYDIMAAGKTCDEFLRAKAATPLEQQIQHAAGVHDDQLPWVLSFAEKTVNLTGVQSAIIHGAVLHSVSLLENTPVRRELTDCLYEDQGLSRSEGHRCIQIWLTFGLPLLTEPKLQKQFCVSALAILSESRTPVAAREEALQLARDGEKLTIKRAQALQIQHGLAPEPPPAESAEPDQPTPRTSRKRNPKSPKWLFVGSVARIEVIPNAGGDIADVDSLIRDLESAIDQLRSGGASQQVA